ncbi:MAG: lipopolysaccharide biosynthesis protein [Prevotella sp.]|jgi:O-antigen/teichoic acid export membrane protein|nr:MULTISPECIES: lipopolysaccharide biosynthesis protein [unclassified Prevotella]MCH3969971.1 lipopolysaccharide biosynthesis protein [Prevotella sp.]MCH3984670.1 lipopolysaccharide biosynthesis protein [Prevotella sp.]MCH4018450.1 lipopolysaccharide biosynthesis protein [Prevotella sp.]MCH4100453.1 lipopolysaccharide biosynthesis protein [Prevotella sp.]MCH4186006.1 lipopolysaccharide biosynthesis protein [Prevotella sp.]
MSSLKEKTASGLFWAAMNNGCMQILNAIIGIFLARLLLPADYGLVGMLTIFSAIATTLQESGFTSALTNKKRATDNDYNSVFWFCNFLGILLYLVLFFCAPLIADFFHQPKLVLLSRVDFLCILLSAIGIVPQAYLYKNLMIKQTTLLRVSVLALSGIAGITMALNGMAYWSIVTQQLIYVGLQSLGKFFLMPWRPSFHIDFQPVRKMFGFSSKILITNVIGQISSNILTVIFGRLLPVKTVGNFTQANKWNGMASSTVSGMIAQVAQPVFSSIQDEGDRQLNVLRKMMRFTSYLSFPAMFGLAVIAPEFIILLISDKWADSIPILQILCVSGAIAPLYLPLQNLMISHGRSDLFMWVSIAQIIVQCTIILAFARYGILTMIAVYSLFYMLWTIIWQMPLKRIVGYTFLNLLQDTIPFMLSALFAVGIAYISTMTFHSLIIRLILKVIIAAGIYYLLMRLAHAKIQKDCLNYLFHRNKNL